MSEIKITPRKKSKKQNNFEASRAHLSDREIQMELLYVNWLIENKTERTRSNTSKLVWFVVIGILLSFFSTFLIGLL